MTFKEFLQSFRGEFELVAGDQETSCTIVWDEYRLTAKGEALFKELLESEVDIISTYHGTCVTSPACFDAGETFACFQAGFCPESVYDEIFKEGE